MGKQMYRRALLKNMKVDFVKIDMQALRYDFSLNKEWASV